MVCAEAIRLCSAAPEGTRKAVRREYGAQQVAGCRRRRRGPKRPRSQRSQVLGSEARSDPGSWVLDLLRSLGLSGHDDPWDGVGEVETCICKHRERDRESDTSGRKGKDRRIPESQPCQWKRRGGLWTSVSEADRSREA